MQGEVRVCGGGGGGRECAGGGREGNGDLKELPLLIM